MRIQRSRGGAAAHGCAPLHKTADSSITLRIFSHKFFAMKNFPLLVVLLIFFSCNKPAVEYNKEFEGVWRSIPIFSPTLNNEVMSEIVIQGEDGTFRNACNPCGQDLCNCLNYQAGKAVMNNSKTQLRIGSSGFALTIQEEPNLDSNGVWTMKVQDLRYYRQ